MATRKKPICFRLSEETRTRILVLQNALEKQRGYAHSQATVTEYGLRLAEGEFGLAQDTAPRHRFIPL
jgi:hypothetical protein